MINNKNVFPYDSNKLFYFVREGYTNDPIGFSWRAEGYCRSLKLISEMIAGSVQIDGYYKIDIGIGD